MADFELFFDHTCPFCYKGHAFVKELLPKFPKAKITWRPVEAHPKVEEPEHKPYEDLAVQGAFFVREHNKELELAYHERIYKAQFEEKKAVDNISVLAACAAELGVDAAAFTAALEKGTYAQALKEANDHAYEEQKVWAVPTFVCGEKRLDSVPGVGVTKEQVETLLKDCFQ
jgi:predicted DsbA family dithiol-disulfide isomerase